MRQQPSLLRLALPHDQLVQTGSRDTGRFPELDDLNLARCDQFVELGATDADHARSVIDLHADRLDRRRRCHSAALSFRYETGSSIQRFTADSRHPAP